MAEPYRDKFLRQCEEDIGHKPNWKTDDYTEWLEARYLVLLTTSPTPTATTEGCKTCGGKKYVPDSDFDGEPTPCPDCGGTGESDNG